MIAIIAGLILYVIFSIALYRTASYLCLTTPFLSFIPIANILYFLYTTDDLVVEARDSKYRIYAIGGISAYVSFLIGVVLRFHAMAFWRVIAGNTLLIVGIATLFIFCFTAYASFLFVGLKKPIICLVASILIPAPIFMLLASFNIPAELEEVVDLYS